MTAPTNVTLHCQFGMKRHTHITYEELAACVARYKAYAKPREVRQMVALGIPEAVAVNVIDGAAQDVLAALLERKALHARAVTPRHRPVRMPF